MSAFDAPERLPKLERDLREALREEAGLARPDYLSDVLLRTVETRQRPAWTFAERWLPMSLVTSRAVPAPRIPWRVLAVAAVLVILALAAFLIAGSRARVPDPFGRAANGLVAFAKDGDIYTADPVTGRATLVVTGSYSDSEPVWSRDGSMIAFQRMAGPGLAQEQMMVVAPDGSGLRAVSRAFPNITVSEFSPDGRRILFSADDGKGGPTELWIADVQQGVARKVDLGMNPDSWVTSSWLPPNGEEIVIVGFPGGGDPGLFAVDPASGTVVRTIVAPRSNVGMGASAVSPDGSRVAYSAWDGTVQDRYSYRIHVVSIDGSNDHVLPLPPGATFEDAPVWSNDGTRLATVRGYSTDNQQVALAVVPADGSGVGVETTHDITGCCDNFMEWAPDDTSILFSPEDQAGNRTSQVLVDPSTGKATPASWAATSIPTWQRRAP